MASRDMTGIIKVGVGAVVFRGPEVLLIKRGKPPFLGQWSIPGGGLEQGERIRDAIAREVREETGCDIALTGLIDVFEAIAPAGAPENFHMVMIDYAADWVAGEPVAGDDAAAAEFVALEEAFARLASDETRRALEMAVRMRG